MLRFSKHSVRDLASAFPPRHVWVLLPHGLGCKYHLGIFFVLIVECATFIRDAWKGGLCHCSIQCGLEPFDFIMKLDNGLIQCGNFFHSRNVHPLRLSSFGMHSFIYPFSIDLRRRSWVRIKEAEAMRCDTLSFVWRSTSRIELEPSWTMTHCITLIRVRVELGIDYNW